MKYCLTLLFFQLALIHFVSAQKDSDLDSLHQAYAQATKETRKVDLCIEIYSFYNNKDTDSAMKYVNKAYYLSEKINYLEGKIKATGNLGNIYYYLGEDGKALRYYLKSKYLIEQYEAKHGPSKFTKEQFSKNFNNLGTIYLSQGEYQKAEIYFRKSIKIDLENNNELSAAHSYNNIGTIKEHENKYDEALNNYKIALTYKIKANDSLGIPSTLINIGVLKMNEKNFPEATDYFNRSIVYCLKTNNLNDLTLSYINFGDMYFLKHDYQKANEFYFKGIEICKKQKYLPYLSYAYESVALTYSRIGDFKKAYDYRILLAETKDKIYSEDNTRLVKEMQTKFETSKKEKAIKLLKKDKQLQEVEIQTSRKILVFIALLLILSAVFLLYAYRNSKQKKKIYSEINDKNEKLEVAYKIVEEKQHEILDSIKYAKRIQSAILPPPKLVKEFFKDSFILYKPKDIVAGDFYWFEVIEDMIFFAAADCTGHGVPGAMVSVVCNNGLNRAIREFGLSDPGAILDKTREIVIQEFEKSEEEMKDGMDVSLCVLDLKKKALTWAGANNPLWILRKGEILEFKPNKQPIGRYLTSLPFTSHIIQLEEHDEIYIFTDGFQDQFGGEHEKKFKVSQLRKLLLASQSLTMEEKRTEIDHTFEVWKGDLQQVDDVCMIGVRI